MLQFNSCYMLHLQLNNYNRCEIAFDHRCNASNINLLVAA